MKKIIAAVFVAWAVLFGAGVAFAHDEAPIDGVHPRFAMGAQDPSVAPGFNLPISSIFRRDASHYYLKVGTSNTAWQLIGSESPAPEVSVQTFGALCNGISNDTAAFMAALTFANVTGGGVSLPAGKTCKVTQLNFGNIAGALADGIRLRGAGMWGATQSTILFQPAASETGDCTPLANNGAAVVANGGIVLGPGTNHVTFEDMRLLAGSNLGKCIVNLSHTGSSTPGSDPGNDVFHRVMFQGNNAVGITKTHLDVLLAYASWLRFDECWFAIGSTGNIREDSTSGYLTNSIFHWNLFLRGGNPAYSVQLNAPTNVDFSDNAFEVAQNGVYVAIAYGGTFANNWFDSEGAIYGTPGKMFDVGCAGCQISGNWILGGYDGIHIDRNNGGSIINNYFIALEHTPVSLGGSGGVTVEGNYFHGGLSTSTAQVAIDVTAGTGYRIGNNRYYRQAGVREAGYSVEMRATTRGHLEIAGSLDDTINGYSDDSGLWEIDKDAVWKNFRLDASLATGLVKHATTTGVLTIAAAGSDYENPLTFANGLTRTSNAIAADLITGKSGGNTITCGTAASDGCVVTSTSNGTKGKITLGTSGSDLTVDQANHRLGFGTASPSQMLNVVGSAGVRELTYTASTGVLQATGAAASAAFTIYDNVAGVAALKMFSGSTFGGIETGAHGFAVRTSGSNNDRLAVTSDGRLYGFALHNNAGAITGTVAQYVASKTWTPTLTAVANVAASTAYAGQATRVGNVVTMSFRVDIDPTAATTLTRLAASLPIASDLAVAEDLSGTCAAPLTAGYVAAVVGDSTNDRAEVEFTTVADVSNLSWFCTATYVIK